jgi:hypothetical protein
MHLDFYILFWRCDFNSRCTNLLTGNSGIREEYEDLKAKHEELSKSHTDAVATHAKELELLKKQHADVVTASDIKDNTHKEELETLKATHAQKLDEIHDRATTAEHTAHVTELKQLQADHGATIVALKKEHAASQESALSDVEKCKVSLNWFSAKIRES